MGTIVAPTYANLVVGFLEIKLYTIIEVKYGPDKRLEFEEEWFRFLDDCEILLDQLNLMSATELLQILNELNKFVKFTMECHNFKISFLDILINQCDNNVWLDIFFKSTDTRRCVPFNSCHPKKCLKNIPFTLAIRICTIVERERVKQIRLKELAVILKNLKYPTNLIISSFKRARAIPQSQLRQEKEKENNDVIAFVNTHNPNNCNVTNIINKCYRELQTDAVLKDVFNETRLVHAKNSLQTSSVSLHEQNSILKLPLSFRSRDVGNLGANAVLISWKVPSTNLKIILHLSKSKATSIVIVEISYTS